MNKIMFLMMIFTSQLALAASPENIYWRVVSKECGEKSLSTASPENYFLQPGLLVRVYLSSDTSDQQCVSALAYQRQIFSTGSHGDTYVENSNLISSYVRTVCRKLVNGKPVNPPLSDQTVQLPKSKEKMLALGTSEEGNALSIRLTETDECPDDILSIEAIKN